jgi:uncharacterized protein (DUF697 family)
MKKKLNEGIVMKTLDYCYDAALNGLPGLGTAEEIANNYKNMEGSLEKKAKKLVRWQVAKCFASGFMTGLGGIITLPIALPANIVSVLYVQIRMIAAIAALSGEDLRDDRVKTLVFLCLCGSAVGDVMKDVGIKIGTKLTTNAIKKISGETIKKINERVGFRLVTKFGQKGSVNLGKAIPIAGGIIGGTWDAVSTKIIGNVARKTFV